MQQMWTDIDDYINSHLIPTDPRLQHALDNTDTQGFSNHLAVAPNQGMFLQMSSSFSRFPEMVFTELFKVPEIGRAVCSRNARRFSLGKSSTLIRPETKRL